MLSGIDHMPPSARKKSENIYLPVGTVSFRKGIIQINIFLISPWKYVVGTHLKHYSYFVMKTYVVGIHFKHLIEALQMSTHNIRFHREIRKIFYWKKKQTQET